MEKWLLVDGYNLAFRSFYAVPELTRQDGFPTNAVHGWIRTLWRIEEDHKPCKLAVFFDLGGATAREELRPEYKATRTETPKALEQQIPIIKDLTEALGYGRIELRGVEADDLIGFCACHLAKEGKDVLIVSADKDLAQCLKPGIRQLLPPPTMNPKLGWRILDHEGVKEKFGVRPDQIPDYLALIGDTVDNVVGLAGVGPKTAAKWLNSYGSLEAVIQNCGKLTPKRFQSIVHENADRLRENLQITTLEPDHDPGHLKFPEIDVDRAGAILLEMEMRTAHKDLLKRAGRA